MKSPASSRTASPPTANNGQARDRSLGGLFAAAVGLQQQGRLNEAAQIYRSILAVDSRHFESLHNLGYLDLQQNRHDEAARLLRRAVQLRPNSADAWNTLGLIRHTSGKFREAAACFERAAASDPRSAQAHNNLGAALHKLEFYDRAVECYRRALALDPRYTDAHKNLGNALQGLGDIDGARSAYAAAIGLAPQQPSLYLGLAACKRFTAGDPDLEALERLAQQADKLPQSERVAMHFALAKALADIGEHARSFGELVAGNALKRRELIYDEPATLAKFERIRRVFGSGPISGGAAAGEPSPVPVFVIGMMRSGTTLIEQILASHPEVVGAGERADFAQAVDAVLSEGPGGKRQYPEGAASLTAKELRRIGHSYLARMRKRDTAGAARIVNKLPTNFLYAGLIAMALPNARIIHARRDPVDTCISCFSILFQGDLPFAYDLGELARYYRAYDALMAHWRAALPHGMMIEVDYEALVDDIEGQARRLIAHCGLDWDPACLSFHSTRRIVATASAAQVRRPLYRSSVGRARAYGELLRPLRDALAR